MSAKPAQAGRACSSDSTASTPLCIVVASDNLSASLHAEPSALSRSWDKTELQSMLSKLGIPASEELAARLDALCQLRKRPPRQDTFPLVSGVAPTPAKPACIKWCVELGRVVSNGQCVGTLVAGAPGENGVDIFGRPVPCPTGSNEPPGVGDGLRLDGASNTVLAGVSGLLTCDDDGILQIEQALTIPRRVDRTLGSIQSQQSIVCLNAIRDGACVFSHRTVQVNDAIEASVVHAGVDVHVDGGIVCRDRGEVIAGRDVRCRYIHHSRVHAQHDVIVESEVLGSEVVCRGMLRAPNAVLLSSFACCARGAELLTVGSNAFVKTTVEIGTDSRFHELFDAVMPIIEANRKRIKHVRQAVEPLMQNQKRLTNEQKERTTELLYDAETMQTETDRKFSVLKTMFDQLLPILEASLTVHDVIYPGTTVRFAGIETTIRSTLKGPVRLQASGRGSHRRIFAFFGDKPTAHPLETRTVTDDALITMQKHLAA
ncbi:MAG: FapA family protein [Tepidisphaeraceae bacterium]